MKITLLPTADETPNTEAPLRPIVGYFLDEDSQWVANLSCGHTQHVRHDPPWQNRPWTQTDEGRESMLGHRLPCRLCLEEANAAL